MQLFRAKVSSVLFVQVAVALGNCFENVSMKEMIFLYLLRSRILQKARHVLIELQESYRLKLLRAGAD